MCFCKSLSIFVDMTQITKYMFVDYEIFVVHGTYLWIVCELQLFKSNKNFHRNISIYSPEKCKSNTHLAL